MNLPAYENKKKPCNLFNRNGPYQNQNTREIPTKEEPIRRLGFTSSRLRGRIIVPIIINTVGGPHNKLSTESQSSRRLFKSQARRPTSGTLCKTEGNVFTTVLVAQASPTG